MPDLDDIRDDVDDLSDDDLIVLSLLHNKALKITRIQKMSLFVEKILLTDSSSKHGAYHYGGFSDGIDESLNSMKGDGSVSIDSKRDYSLTKYGDLIYEEALKDEEIKAKIYAIEGLSDFFCNLTDQQLLYLSYILYPETTEESLIKDKVLKRANKTEIGDIMIQSGLTKDEAIGLLCKELEGPQ